MNRLILPMMSALSLTACTYREPQGGAPMPMIDASGRTVGTVTAWDSPGGVGLRIRAAGLPHGIHGIHVHETGQCALPDFKSAGSHWNPASRKHGLSNPAGPHGGDLPNVVVAANGVLDTMLTIAGASLTPGGGLIDADGAALVLHADADDNTTDPSGNSGGRIACVVLQPTTAAYGVR